MKGVTTSPPPRERAEPAKRVNQDPGSPEIRAADPPRVGAAMPAKVSVEIASRRWAWRSKMWPVPIA